MTIERDPRYDLLLVDSPDGDTINESLGLILREPNGLDFSINFVSPQSQLPGADTQDADSSRSSVRTQRNWQAGLGREYGYGDLIGFSEGNVDTRFREQIILPPQPLATVLTNTAPIVYEDSRVRLARPVNAAWDRGDRVDGESLVEAVWVNEGQRSETQRAVYVQHTNATVVQQGGGIEATPFTIISSGCSTSRAAISFVTPSEIVNLTSIGVYIYPTSVAVGGRVSIYTDNAGQPGIEVVGRNITTPEWNAINPTTGAWHESPVSTDLDPFTTYWIVVSTTTTNASIRWRYGLTGTGAAMSNNCLSGWASSANVFPWYRLNQGQDIPVKTARYVAQQFTPPDLTTVTAVNMYLSLSSVSAGPPNDILFLQLREDDNGSPSNVVLAEEEIDVGTISAAGWYQFTIISPVSADTPYWIVLVADTPINGNAVNLSWWGDSNVTGAAAGPSRIFALNPTSQGWGSPQGSCYFGINNGYDGNPKQNYFLQRSVRKAIQAQQFNVPTGFTLTEVSLFLRRGVWTGDPEVRLWLYTDDGAGNIGTPIDSSGSMDDPGEASTWVDFSFSIGLSSATNYWLVLIAEVSSENLGDGVQLYWRTDTMDSYGSGEGRSQSWPVNSDEYQTAVAANDHYFVLNDLTTDPVLAFYTHGISQARVGQLITPNASVALQRVRITVQIAERSGAAGLRVSIFATVDGAPTTEIVGYNLTDADLAELPSGNPDLGGPELNVTQRPQLATALLSTTLSSGTVYAIVVSSTANAVGDSISALVWGDPEGGYAGGYGVYSDYVDGAYGSWNDAEMDFFFYLNPGTLPFQQPIKTNPIRYGSDWFIAAGQYIFRLKGTLLTNGGFESGTGSWTNDWDGSMSFVRIQTEATEGAYAASITSITGTYASIYQNVTSLTEGRRYTASGMFKIAVVTGANYSFALHFLDGGLSAIETVIVNIPATIDWQRVTVEGVAPAGTVAVRVQPYVPAGGTLYVDDVKLTHNAWTQVLDAGVPVTDLEVLATNLYAALGDSTDMQFSSDGTTWGAVSGSRRYTHLRSFGGFMYAAKSSGGVNALAYTDGSTWVTNLQVSTSDQRITGLASYNNELIVLGRQRMWSLSGTIVYQIHDYSFEEEDDNGRNAITWIRDGRLHVPVRAGLNAYNGAQMEAVGPDGEEGLPLGLRGRISAMVGTKAWLFAAIDAGPLGTSGIYAYNGTGWHTIALATGVGRRIRAIGLESTSSPEGLPRLWWGEDNVAFYVEFPNLSDNPYAYVPTRFAQTGTLTSSKLGGEVAVIPKDFQSISVWSQGCSANQRIEVYYEVDNAGIWVLAGTITQSPFTEFFLQTSEIVVKTIAVGSGVNTIFVSETDDTSDMSPGEFIRIGTEIAQVRTVDTSNSFTLVQPLVSEPVIGGSIYPAGPAGKSIRYRLTLITDNQSLSPKANRVSIKMRGLWSDKARIAFGPRIEDNLFDRVGGAYPYSAAELRELLYDWIKRDKPIVIVDPMGKNWVAYHAATSEVNMRRTDELPPNFRISSGMRIEMLER